MFRVAARRRFLPVGVGVWAALAVLNVPPAGAVVASPDVADPPVAEKTSLVIGLANGAADDEGALAAAVVARLDGQPDVTVLATGAVEGLRAVTVQVPAAEQERALSALRGDESVRYAEVDGLATATASTKPVDDPHYSWSLDDVRMPSAWTWTTGSPDVTIAVVDSGVTPVRDLDDGRVLPGRDFVDDDADAADDDRHGTMVASGLAAQANNGYGVAGVCPRCRILPVRVLAKRAGGVAAGRYSAVAAGIVWAADHGAQVINLSLAGTTDGQVLRDAVRHATSAGALVVAAAGNDGGTDRRYPAAIDEVLAVGEVTREGRRMWTSTHNGSDPWIDVAGPNYLFGVHPYLPSVPVHVLGGTSAATTVVAGTAALAFALQPGAGAARIRDVIVGHARQVESRPAAPVLDAARVTTAVGPGDDVKPVVATGLSAGDLIGVRGRRFTARASDDHLALDRVELVVGGKVVETLRQGPWEFFWWPPIEANGPTAFTVRAVDYAGNVGEATTPVTVDTTYPDVRIVAPTTNGPFGAFVPVTVASRATDVARVTIGDVTIDATSVKSPWTARVKASAVAPSGLIKVDVRDRAGNVGASGVHADVRAPVVSLATPAAGTLVGPTTRIQPTIDEPFGLSDTSLHLDGKLVGRTWSSLQPSFTLPRGVNRPVTLSFRATDLWGHVGVLTRRVVVDTAGPSLPAYSPRVGSVVRGTVTSQVTGVADTHGVARADLWVNGVHAGTDRAAPYALPVRTGGRTGPVTLVWRVTDRLGNTSTRTQRIAADHRPPAVSIGKAPKHKATVRGTVTVPVSASDSSGIARVELLVDGKVVARDTTAAYRLSVNTAKQKKTMKIQVRAYDRAGNVRYASARTWYRR